MNNSPNPKPKRLEVIGETINGFFALYRKRTDLNIYKYKKFEPVRKNGDKLFMLPGYKEPVTRAEVGIFAKNLLK